MTRIRRGWSLAKDSWAVLRNDRSLAIFPLISFAATVVAFALLITPGLVGAAAANRDWVVLPFLAAAGYAATFIAIYFNVALAGAAQLSLDGKDTTLQDGLAVARSRRGVIARWAAVQFVVGLLINVVENAFGDSPAGRAVGALVGTLLGAAWSISTFFVIPVLALEGLTPKAAFDRSIGLTKERWGEGLVGNAAISLAVFLVAGIPILILFFAGSSATTASPALGGVLMALAVVLGIGAMVAGSALSVIFRVALYRFAITGAPTGGFSAAELSGAFRTKG